VIIYEMLAETFFLCASCFRYYSMYSYFAVVVVAVMMVMAT
jgi:hypothetical protein